MRNDGGHGAGRGHVRGSRRRGDADTDANGYNNWWDKKVSIAGTQARVAVSRFVASLQQFPPRQRPGTFTVDQIMEALYQHRPE